MPRQWPQAQGVEVCALAHCAVDRPGGSNEDGIGQDREEEFVYGLFGSKLRPNQGQIYNGSKDASNKVGKKSNKTCSANTRNLGTNVREDGLHTRFGRSRL